MLRSAQISVKYGMDLKITRIACIGSRSLSDQDKGKLFDLGIFIVEKGWYIVTGGARGSDAAFAAGGNEVNPNHVLLYLPNEHYNKELIVPGNRVCVDIKPEWTEIARKHHPRYDYLSTFVKRLMDRNAGIIIKADKVLANFSKTSKTNGTGHGFRIAETLGIPRLDISDKSFEEVVKFLDE